MAPELQLVVAASGALVIGALVRPMLKWLRLPYSVVLLLIGLVLGLVSRSGVGGESAGELAALVQYLAHLDPHLILALFLPILIFQSSLSFESHLFRQLLKPMLWLAIPGIVIATLITALLCWWWLPYGWGWREALLFGALISATDPVAVVALLRELGARAGLETIIEGESLLNDGTAIVLFVLVLQLFSGDVDWALVPLQFLWVVMGGAAIGVVLALLLRWAMAALNDDPSAQIGLTLAAAFGCYLLAEHLGLSGVVALVALGVLLGRRLRSTLSESGRLFLRQLWEFLASSANTLIFLIVGLIIGALTPLSGATPWAALLLAYLIIHVARGAMLLLLWPWLQRQIPWLDGANGLVLWWGGLRGAVGLVLALSLLHRQLPAGVADALLFLTAGIVLMTLLINAPLTPKLLARFALDQPSPERLAALAARRETLHSKLQQALAEGAPALGLAAAEWPRLEEALAGCWHSFKLPEPFVAAELIELERQAYERLYAEGWLAATTLERLLERLEEAREHADLDRTRLLRAHGGLSRPHWWRPLLRVLHGQYMARFGHHLVAEYGELLAFEQTQRQLLAAASEREAPPLRANLTVINRRLQQWRQQFPELVVASETALAAQLLLVRQLRQIEQWLVDGVLSDSEAQQLRQEGEARLARCQQWLRHLAPSLRDELSQWPALATLGGHGLEPLLQGLRRRWLAEGELLGRQGEAVPALLLLWRGEVQLIRASNGQIEDVRLLAAGSRLGPESLSQRQWAATTKAVSDLLLLELPWSQVAHWRDHNPALWQALDQLPGPLLGGQRGADATDPG